eukprot:g30401.t1
MSLNATDDKEGYFQRWSEGFLERHWPLALIMALEILVVGGLYLFHLAWIRVQRQRAKDPSGNSAVMRLTEALSLELLRRFLPSAKVEKYRFRGMGKKKAAWHLTFPMGNQACCTADDAKDQEILKIPMQDKVPGAEDLKTEQKLEAIREEEKEEKKEEPKREGFTITFLDKKWR